MNPTLKEAAMQAAADDQRTLTSLIEKLLTDYCRERGYLPTVLPPVKAKAAEKRVHEPTRRGRTQT